MDAHRYSFISAAAAGYVATNQTEQFKAWIASVAALSDLTSEYAGAEQVARICRRVIGRDLHGTEREWHRLQSAYWVSTDGYGKLDPARLRLVSAF